MSNWLILGLAAITFGNRAVFFSQSLNYRPGPEVRRFLGYSVYAVLTAIWLPLLVSADRTGSVEIAGIDYLVGTLLAAILTWVGVRSIMVVLVSISVFFVLRLLVL